MKTEIDSEGNLKLKAENPSEDFLLNCWMDKLQSKHIVISIQLTNLEEESMTHEPPQEGKA